MRDFASPSGPTINLAFYWISKTSNLWDSTGRQMKMEAKEFLASTTKLINGNSAHSCASQSQIASLLGWLGGKKEFARRKRLQWVAFGCWNESRVVVSRKDSAVWLVTWELVLDSWEIVDDLWTYFELKHEECGRVEFHWGEVVHWQESTLNFTAKSLKSYQMPSFSGNSTNPKST